MHFRYSHLTRQRLTKERKRRHTFRYAGLGTAVFVLLAFAALVLVYADRVRSVADWLQNRAQPVSFPGYAEYARTADAKNDQQAFHALDKALYGALINLQVVPGRIRDEKPRRRTGEGVWTPVERHVTVSSAYSLTECNLEISRAISRLGGTIVRAAERSRTRDLLLEIAHNGAVTHHLYITRSARIPRKTGRLALVIACPDGDCRDVVEAWSEFPRPVTLALPPWVSGVGALAGEIARGNHEAIAMLPVQPDISPRNLPRGNSLLAAHSEATNRRIVEDALESLPASRGVLGYPGGGRPDDEAEALVPVLDELGKRDKYFVAMPASGTSPAGPEMPDGGSGLLRAWGVLDPVYNPVTISMNLDRAANSALENGRAIVIAEARPLAFRVLTNQMARLELRGIEFVRASDLLDN